jgi:hypothetical protein
MVSWCQYGLGLQLMTRKITLGLVLAILAGMMVGCEGSQIVNAPAKKPDGVGMSRGMGANNSESPPEVNQGK